LLTGCRAEAAGPSQNRTSCSSGIPRAPSDGDPCRYYF